MQISCAITNISPQPLAEPEYAEKLIKHAKQMLEFGLAHPGSYMTSQLEGLKDHSKHYPSSNYNDEMAWGALWLHLATGVSQAVQHPEILLYGPARQPRIQGLAQAGQAVRYCDQH